MKSRSFFSLGAVLTAASVAMFSVADMVGSRLLKQPTKLGWLCLFNNAK